MCRSSRRAWLLGGHATKKGPLNSRDRQRAARRDDMFAYPGDEELALPDDGGRDAEPDALDDVVGDDASPRGAASTNSASATPATTAPAKRKLATASTAAATVTPMASALSPSSAASAVNTQPPPAQRRRIDDTVAGPATPAATPTPAAGQPTPPQPSPAEVALQVPAYAPHGSKLATDPGADGVTFVVDDDGRYHFYHCNRRCCRTAGERHDGWRPLSGGKKSNGTAHANSKTHMCAERKLAAERVNNLTIREAFAGNTRQSFSEKLVDFFVNCGVSFNVLESQEFRDVVVSDDWVLCAYRLRR